MEWDEARNGVNAYEMLQRNDYTNLYYGNETDTWNAKPPLMTWCIIALYQLLGYNEWALRLPSAIATLLFFIVFFYFIRHVEGTLYAFLSSLILLACKAMIGFHTGINGDFDAMLSLFLLLSAYCFFLHTEFANPRHLYLAAIFTGLAFYTKGTAAFLFIPGLILYATIKGKCYIMLKKQHFWMACGIFFLIAASWIIIGLYYSHPSSQSVYGSKNPIETMLVHDTFRRLTSNDFDNTNTRDYLFFFKAADARLNIWNYIFYFSVATGLFMLVKNRDNLKEFLNRDSNRLTLFSVCIVVPVAICLNFAVNMHDWYYTPIWGFIAIIIVKSIRYYAVRQRIIPYVFAAVLILTCVRHIVYLKNLSEDLHHAFQRSNPAFSKETYVILTSNPKQNMLLYLHWMNMEFIKTDINISQLRKKHKGKILIAGKDEIDKAEIGHSIQPIQYAGEYFIGEIL